MSSLCTESHELLVQLSRMSSLRTGSFEFRVEFFSGDLGEREGDGDGEEGRRGEES
jgi:hypothetical protein